MFSVLDSSQFSLKYPSKDLNEDSVLAPLTHPEFGLFFAIADGVGSYHGASSASEIAISCLRDYLKEQDFNMLKAFEVAKERIDNMASINPELRMAATTLTIVNVNEKGIHIGHVGDCRVYLKSNNRLQLLTKDHTRYQEYLDSGEHPARKLKAHKERLSSVLINALSLDLPLSVQETNIPHSEIESETMLVLMSDGAYKFWDLRPKFSDSTMANTNSFANSLRRRIERAGPVDDYSLVGVSFKK